MEVAWIMWVRQMRRYVRSRARIVGSLGQPLLFMVALGYGLGQVFRQAGQGDYLQFLVPGVMAQSVLFTSIFAGTEVIWDRQFGFLKETLVAPVSRLEVMLGRTLGGATVATLQGLLVLLVACLVGFRLENPAGLPMAALTMLLAALLFTSLGTAIACLVDDMHGFQLIMNFLVMPLFFLSGAIFPLDSAPPWLRTVAALDPLTYGVDALRAYLLGTSHFPLVLSLGVLGVGGAALLSLSSLLFARIED